MTTPDEYDVTNLIGPLRIQANAAAENALATRYRDWKYTSVAALLLDVGRLFIPPAGEWPVPAEHRGESGTCYATSTAWSTSTGLAYVEGVAINGTDPAAWLGTEHAWCAEPGRTAALDPTWAPDTEPGAYIGLPVTADYRRTVRHPAILAPEWGAGLELLEHGVPADALADCGWPIPTPATPAR